MITESLSRISQRLSIQRALLQANLDRPDRFEVYREAVMTAFGVRPEVQDFIKSHSTFEVGDIPGYGGGWYPPADYTSKGRIVMARWQAEGTLHEDGHVWYHWFMRDHLGEQRALAYEVAVCGTTPREDAGKLDCEPQTLDFLRGYYEGIGQWPGMYDMDGTGPNAKVVVGDFIGKENADISNVIIWEIMAGLISYTMGRIFNGPRRLPVNVRPFLVPFFTGDIMATPYYGG